MVHLQVIVIVIEMSVVVIVLYAMSMQLFNYLPLRPPSSTKVRRKTGCWILFAYLFSYTLILQYSLKCLALL